MTSRSRGLVAVTVRPNVEIATVAAMSLRRMADCTTSSEAIE